MRRYLRIYKILLALNWEQLVVYRANLVNNLISSSVWGAFIVFSMLLFTSRTPSVFGWSRDEIMLLVGIFTAAIGIFHAICTRNFEQLSRITNLGRLDALLVKPVDSQFLVSLWMVNFAALPRVIWGLVFAGYFFNRLTLQLTWQHFFLSVSLLMFGLVLLYALWMFVITITIWFTRLSNLVELMFNITGMARFPREMFSSSSNFVFFLVLPLTFIMVTPTKVLLQRATYGDILGLLGMTGFFFLLARKFWQFALKYYTSASS